ncbi:hypothetical protein [Pseudomonas sp.]|uniref:hypothetical protein n=1 Tax=Pseudomonas sp. TaxID=306 RepID=UPI0026140E36|nr:hypothetical protein [Pseudomonas sp.]
MWGFCLMLGLVLVVALFLCLRRRWPRVRRPVRRPVRKASACLGGEEQHPLD